MTATFETIAGGMLLTLGLSELWGALARYPRLIGRVEILEVRREEDRIQVDLNSQTRELMKVAFAEAAVNFKNLQRQCEDDRVMQRQMQQDWTKSQKDLGEAVVQLRTTLTMINQTLRHSDRTRDE
jgi:hypothetical protein